MRLKGKCSWWGYTKLSYLTNIDICICHKIPECYLKILTLEMYYSLQTCFYTQLAGVPGVARDDRWRNPIASFFIYNKKRGLNNLWKCVTVKYVPCYLRKAPVLTKKCTHARKNTSFLSHQVSIFTHVHSVHFSTFSMHYPQCKTLPVMHNCRLLQCHDLDVTLTCAAITDIMLSQMTLAPAAIFCPGIGTRLQQKRSKRSNIVGPYIPYGLFQTKREMCAKFGSDWFTNVNLYKVQTNKLSAFYI